MIKHVGLGCAKQKNKEKLILVHKASEMSRNLKLKYASCLKVNKYSGISRSKYIICEMPNEDAIGNQKLY